MANYFEAEISRSMKAFGWHGKKLVVFRHEEFYDFWLLVDGIHYGMEAKSTRDWSSFPFDRLQEHQLKGLLDCEESKGTGYVLLNYRNNAAKKKQLVAFAIKAKDWVRLKDEIFKDRKSIPTSAFSEYPDIFIPIPQLKSIENKMIWDLRIMLPKSSPASTGGYTCPTVTPKKQPKEQKKASSAKKPDASQKSSQSETTSRSYSKRSRGRRRQKAA